MSQGEESKIFASSPDEETEAFFGVIGESILVFLNGADSISWEVNCNGQ